MQPLWPLPRSLLRAGSWLLTWQIASSNTFQLSLHHAALLRPRVTPWLAPPLRLTCLLSQAALQPSLVRPVWPLNFPFVKRDEDNQSSRRKPKAKEENNVCLSERRQSIRRKKRNFCIRNLFTIFFSKLARFCIANRYQKYENVESANTSFMSRNTRISITWFCNTRVRLLRQSCLLGHVHTAQRH